MKIFLSYASNDERNAEEIAYALQQDGHDVFIASGTLRAADDYHTTLRNEVGASDLFVFLVSEHSTASGRYTLSELEAAKRKWPDPSGHVLPVVLDSDALAGADAWLRAVTVLEPKGSVAAETVGCVAAMQQPPPHGDVLLDAGHGQDDWKRLPPTASRGYGRLVDVLGQRLDLEVAELSPGSGLTARNLADFKAVILPLAPDEGTNLPADEVSAIESFVSDGGGLLVLGTYTGDWHHEANLNSVLDRFGLHMGNDSLVAVGASPTGHLFASEPSSGHAFSATTPATDEPHALASGLGEVRMLSCCSISTLGDAAAPLLIANRVDVYEPNMLGIGVAIDGYTKLDSKQPVVAAYSKVARVVAIGSWKTFLDPFLAVRDYSNDMLLRNIVAWVTQAP